MFGRSTPAVVVVNGSQVAPANLDSDAVWEALESRQDAAEVYANACEAYLDADALYRNKYNDAYIHESGPEHLRKAVAEQAAAGLRAARDAAEVAKVRADEGRRVAELAWRSAMGGASPDGGERA